MATVSTVCSEIQNECKKWLNIVYNDHNPDPIASFNGSLLKLSDKDIDLLSNTGTINEILKTSRGNGKGLQTISCGMNAFAEIPNVDNNNNNGIEITQQHNVGNGFAFRNPSTWIKRVSSDHMRRGKSKLISSDIFSINLELKSQLIFAEPMKINLSPNWDPSNKNFLNGQEIDAYYKSISLWSTKCYFKGSMITPLCDPRQITIIIQSGYGIIQSSFGLLTYKPGDLIQIPPHTPFCFYVKSGYIVKCICYYSKEDLIFPETQLNVSDLNQIPFSPSIVIQSKYSLNESNIYKYRGEYVRIEQSNGNYNLYYFNKCQTAFNWIKWVHNGPIIHKVNLIENFERIGSNKGHKDPNIWLILKHSFDKSFGIAFITGKSFIQINDGKDNDITYPPAYFHLNGVHEKGEVILFDNGTSGGYDARKGFNDGDCLLHPAGVGHGGDKHIYKYFINKAIIKYILKNNNYNNKIIKTLINRNKYIQFMKINKNDRDKRIENYIKNMYSFDFNGNEYNDDKNIEFNVKQGINHAIDNIINNNNNKGINLQVLGMPFGIGYLLVECRDIPIIPKPDYNSTFRQTTQISYGMDVDILVNEANKYLKKLNKSLIKSSL